MPVLSLEAELKQLPAGDTGVWEHQQGLCSGSQTGEDAH